MAKRRYNSTAQRGRARKVRYDDYDYADPPNPFTAPLVALAVILGVACIIAAWPILPTVATVLIYVCLFGAVVGMVLFLLSYGVSIYGKWFSATILEPVDELGNYQTKVSKGGKIIQPVGNSAVFSQVTHLGNNSLPGRNEAPALELPYSVQELPAAEVPDKVDLLQSLRLLNPSKEGLEVFFGQTATGPIIKPFGEETLHIGNVGATGSGKSVQSQSILFQLAAHDTEARRVRFGFIDFEGKTSKPFAKAPHTEFIVDEPESARIALAGMIETMDERAHMSEERLAQEPLYVIMIEEFLDLQDSLPSADWQKLIKLAIRGRKSKFFLMLASQALYSSEDTRVLRGQIRTRNAFAFEDDGTAKAFGIKDMKMLEALRANPRPGRFLQRTMSGIVLAQAPYISEGTISLYFDKLNAMRREERSKGRTSPAGGREDTGWHGSPATPKPHPGTVVNGTYRELPTGPDEASLKPRRKQPPKGGTMFSEAVAAYQRGHTTVRTLAAELTRCTGINCANGTAEDLINEMKAQGYI